MRVLVDEQARALGRGLGASPSRPSATRTTRCCPRRSRSGRSRCSSASCRGTCRSSTRSTSASCARCRSATRRRRAAAAHVAHRGGRARSRCAWRTSRSSAAHSVNGVAALHTELLERDLLRDFDEMFPERFNNKTNGVTPRRWLLRVQPAPVAAHHRAHRRRAGSRTSIELEKLAPLADDAGVPRRRSREVKRANKDDLARARARALMRRRASTRTRIFDVQIKRLHEYKRQLLNALHIVALWIEGAARPERASSRRARSSSARKAAPGYQLAKLHHPAHQRHRRGGQQRRRAPTGAAGACSCPNYRVSLAERIIPAADVSEQISTAGKEASGTGNMKFALNGALTIGTLDGANVEIREAVGDGELLPLRPHRGRGDRAQERRLPPARRSTSEPRSCARRSTSSPRASSRPRTSTSSSRWSTACSRRTATWCSRTSRPTRRSSRSVARAYQDTDALDAHGHPQRRPRGRLLLGPHHQQYAEEIWDVKRIPVGT